MKAEEIVEETTKVTTFPVLKKFISDRADKSFVVMFIRPKEGVVVLADKKADWNVGSMCDAFSDHNNTSVWSHYNGVITLEND